MNEIARIPASQDEMIRVLGNSLYPGARPESIALVLSWCKVNGLDPMLRPVHIVPQRIKNERGQWETRDTLMPGIATYRILAARTGEYCGKSEPEFGPDQTRRLGEVEITYPQWCKVTVQRMIHGEARTFAAKEFWIENYATAGADTEAPNKMWRKRVYGQLAKVAEAQALRQAFPEWSGGAPTAEEMEGRSDSFAGPTIDARAEQAPRAQPKAAAAPRQPTTAEYLGDDLPDFDSDRYPFTTKHGTTFLHSGPTWAERWRYLIEQTRKAGILDKLRTARELNEPHFAAVAEYDAALVAEIREAIETALSPAAQADPETDAAEPEPEMALP